MLLTFNLLKLLNFVIGLKPPSANLEILYIYIRDNILKDWQF